MTLLNEIMVLICDEMEWMYSDSDLFHSGRIYKRIKPICEATDAVIKAAREFRECCEMYPRCSGCSLETICQSYDAYDKAVRDG